MHVAGHRRHRIQIVVPVRRHFGAAALSLAAAAILIFTSCTRPHIALRAGYSEFYPYVTSGPDGKPTGMAVQVVQEAAARAAIPLKWIKVSQAEQALRAGEV